jgi:hypothetical protein
MRFQYILACLTLAALSLHVPLHAYAANGATASCTGPNENYYFNCDINAGAQTCADNCNSIFGGSVNVTGVYVSGAIAGAALATLTTYLIMRHYSHKAENMLLRQKKMDRRKKRRDEDDDSSLPPNSDLLPSRASLQAVPAS